jgi:hypothetical protein
MQLHEHTERKERKLHMSESSILKVASTLPSVLNKRGYVLAAWFKSTLKRFPSTFLTSHFAVMALGACFEPDADLHASWEVVLQQPQVIRCLEASEWPEAWEEISRLMVDAHTGSRFDLLRQHYRSGCPAVYQKHLADKSCQQVYHDLMKHQQACASMELFDLAAQPELQMHYRRYKEIDFALKYYGALCADVQTYLELRHHDELLQPTEHALSVDRLKATAIAFEQGEAGRLKSFKRQAQQLDLVSKQRGQVRMVDAGAPPPGTKLVPGIDKRTMADIQCRRCNQFGHYAKSRDRVTNNCPDVDTGGAPKAIINTLTPSAKQGRGTWEPLESDSDGE